MVGLKETDTSDIYRMSRLYLIKHLGIYMYIHIMYVRQINEEDDKGIEESKDSI